LNTYVRTKKTKSTKNSRTFQNEKYFSLSLISRSYDVRTYSRARSLSLSHTHNLFLSLSHNQVRTYPTRAAVLRINTLSLSLSHTHTLSLFLCLSRHVNQEGLKWYVLRIHHKTEDLKWYLLFLLQIWIVVKCLVQYVRTCIIQ
jgi:hypothetical protein